MSKRLKPGEFLLYKAKTLLEKTSVVEVNDEEAKLSNGVLVSSKVIHNKVSRIYKKGELKYMDSDLEILQWDDDIEKIYNGYIAHRNSRNILEKLVKEIDKNSLSDDNLIWLYGKLTRVSDRLGI